MDPLRGLVEAVRDGDDLRASVAAFHAAAKKAKPADRNAMLAALDDVVRDAAPERAGPIAILAGAIVELGGDPRAFPGAVFEQLLDLLRTIRGPEDDAELPDAYYELERGAMACLSRSPELRATLPQKEALLEHTFRHTERYGFLGKMIRVLDDEPLVVLHPGTRRGFRFVMSGVADNFQLHTLLLGALAGKRKNDVPGERPSARALAAAEGGDPSNAPVESDWQLANWFALREGGALDTKDYDKSWIWNEGVPADIALFEDTRVVLIGPSTVHRAWSSGRVFSGMPGKLERRGALARDEVEDLLGGMLR